MKTTVKIYTNKINPNKHLEVHNDGYYHNSVVQYMQWDDIINKTGDRCLHRWKKENLNELLKDYKEDAL